MQRNNVLVIGYGSIGRRHCSVLEKLIGKKNIYVFTKQKKCKFKKILNFDRLKSINPYFVIIASRTYLHFPLLKKIEKNLKNSAILVEKPLFEKTKNIVIKNNKVFVAYNLRFHPILIFLKKYLKNKKIFSVNVKSSSYLPYWRKNIEYFKSNSAKKKYGGGTTLELSHEFDYFQWIFGKIKKVEFVKIKKISKLKIDSEDNSLIIGRNDRTNFIFDLNFYSRVLKREIIVDAKNFSVKADLIKNRIEIFNNEKKKIINFKNNLNKTYIEQIKAILNKNYQNLCTYFEGLELIKFIDNLKKKFT